MAGCAHGITLLDLPSEIPGLHSGPHVHQTTYYSRLGVGEVERAQCRLSVKRLVCAAVAKEHLDEDAGLGDIPRLLGVIGEEELALLFRLGRDHTHAVLLDVVELR